MAQVNSARWLSLEDFEGEVWKQTEFPYYVISNYGRLKRLAHTSSAKGKQRQYKQFLKERICRFSVNAHGYLTFQFHGHKKAKLAHRLVAEAFIPNPHNLPMINHKDENPSNNKVNNLEWCDAKYNSNYGTSRNRRSKTMLNVRKNINRIIKQYTLNGEYIKSFQGELEIKSEGYQYGAITACCRHESRYSQGYVWRYDNEPFGNILKRENTGSTLKPVIEYDMNGEMIAEYESITKASLAKIGKTNGTGNISACCYKEKRTAYGSIWRYKGEEPPVPYKRVYAKVEQYTKDMELVAKYDSISEAIKAMGRNTTNREAITLCCRGKAKTAYGYIWRYADSL